MDRAGMRDYRLLAQILLAQLAAAGREALNAAEAAFAVVVIVAVAAGGATASTGALTAVAAVLLAAQLAAVRPSLNKRSDRVLSGEYGEDLPRSRAHLYYVVLELAKVLALIGLGASLLSG